MIDAITDNDVKDFRNYVKMFYSNERNDSPYPIASNEEIDEAIDEYIESIEEEIQWGYGDSMDRESVRMILEPEYSMWLLK